MKPTTNCLRLVQHGTQNVYQYYAKCYRKDLITTFDIVANSHLKNANHPSFYLQIQHYAEEYVITFLTE